MARLRYLAHNPPSSSKGKPIPKSYAELQAILQQGAARNTPATQSAPPAAEPAKAEEPPTANTPRSSTRGFGKAKTTVNAQQNKAALEKKLGGPPPTPTSAATARAPQQKAPTPPATAVPQPQTQAKTQPTPSRGAFVSAQDAADFAAMDVYNSYER